MGDLTENLSRYEFACKCIRPDCVHTPVDIDLPRVIQDCIDRFADEERERYDPFRRVSCHINSGYRCIAHNDDVTDGAGSGIHTYGMAADIWMEYVYDDGSRKRIDDSEIADYFESMYPASHGIGRYPRDDDTGRTHIDVRKSKARWAA